MNQETAIAQAQKQALEQTARKELFEKVKDAFAKHNGRVFLNAGTGTGKSKIAIDLLEDYLLSSDPIELMQWPWHIIVPSKALIQNWKDEFHKWGKGHLLAAVHIYCHQSLHKQEYGNGPRHIIIDEGQWMTEPKLLLVERLMGTTSKLIVLTATLPKPKRTLYKKLGIDTKNTVVYKLDKGVQDGLVADYKIVVVEFPLDNQAKVIQAGRKGAYFMVTEQEGYNFKTKNMKRGFAQGYGRYGILQRQHYLYNLPSKLKAAQWLQKNIPQDKKTIFFCGSIQQANAVCQHRYHSKTTDADYKAFCEGTIMQMSAVKSIAEGVNIPALDVAVIIQAEESDLSTIQKIGRAARKTDDPNKKAVIFVLSATGTQDQKWVAGALSSFDKSKIDYVSFNQLLNKGLSGIL